MASRHVGSVYRLAARLVRMAVRLLGWRIEVRGAEHVPDGGGAVVAFNHHSYADGLMVAWSIYRERGRPVRFLMKRELFGKPVLGWLLRTTKQVPVDRSSQAGRREAFMAAIEKLRDGELMAVAPEQTISQSFELLPFTTGAVRMARNAGVPMVPCVGWGTHRFATKGRPIRLQRGLPVMVRYGEPIEVTRDDDPHAATERLQEVMAAMLDEVIRDYPDRPQRGNDWWLPRRFGGTAPRHEDFLREHQERGQSGMDVAGSTADERSA